MLDSAVPCRVCSVCNVERYRIYAALVVHGVFEIVNVTKLFAEDNASSARAALASVDQEVAPACTERPGFGMNWSLPNAAVMCLPTVHVMSAFRDGDHVPPVV